VTNGVAVRDARPADRAAIEAVTLAAYEQYAATLGQRLWDVYRQNIVATLAEPRAAAQIVAEGGGALVGGVLLYPAGAVMGEPGSDKTLALAWPEVRLLAVAPASRGAGVGRLLMQECIRRARGAGASALTLHTTDMMSTAMRLYERMGFERVPDLDFAPAPTVVAKGYRLPL
jgi:GNAT superfamily N-acetyltransferase